MRSRAYEFKKIGKVFIGAGQVIRLITVRGQRLMAAADVILYASSLVQRNQDLLLRRRQAGISMSLDEQISLMTTAGNAGKTSLVFIPATALLLHRAIDEQMRRLKKNEFHLKIIPKTSLQLFPALLASPHSASRAHTAPDVTQTLILTRASGRTSGSRS